MPLLGIETSCDDTPTASVRDGLTVPANVSVWRATVWRPSDHRREGDSDASFFPLNAVLWDNPQGGSEHREIFAGACIQRRDGQGHDCFGRAQIEMQEGAAFALGRHQKFEFLPNYRLIAKLRPHETGLRSSSRFGVADESIPSYDASASFFGRERTRDRQCSAGRVRTVSGRSKVRNRRHSRYVFQRVITSPPARMNAPPTKIGASGRMPKASKFTI